MLLIHLEKQPVNTKVQYAFDLWKNDDVEENKHCLLQQCFSVEDNTLTGPCCTHEPFGHTSHHYSLWGSQQRRLRMILPPPSAPGTTPSATVKAGHQEGRSSSVPTWCLHILWPKRVVSSVSGPYHGILVGKQEQVQSNVLLWGGPWDILTSSWWGGFLNTWPWIFHLQPMAFWSIIIPYILLYGKICVFGKFIG